VNSYRNHGFLWKNMPPESSMGSRWWRPKALLIVTVSFFVTLIYWALPNGHAPQLSLKYDPSKSAANVETWCPLPEKPKYPNDGLKPSFLFADKASVDKQVNRLSAAVNVPTVSYDDNGDVGEDKRWEPFYKFHDVLEDLFPLT
jgi:Gly-Xaa carboxypeptidase